ETGPEELGGTDDAPTLFNPAHIQVKASFSMRLQNNFSFGVSASYLSIRYWKGKSKYSSALTRTVLFDVGIMAANFFENTTFGDLNDYPDAQSGVERNKGMSFGISLLNLGPDIYFIDESEKDPPPSVLLLGIDYRILNTQTIGSRIAVDFENRIFDEEKFIHLGGEIDLFQEYALCCGYSIHTADNENSFFTLGAGVNTRYGSLNIARYEKYPVPTWQFDAKLEFGWL
ncbi:MAG: hypothetical protein HY965_01270, partial [Ignavibacteriales bacterium]|nr:hypothetical protein [Ignavibacteriales bacterium]